MKRFDRFGVVNALSFLAFLLTALVSFIAIVGPNKNLNFVTLKSVSSIVMILPIHHNDRTKSMIFLEGEGVFVPSKNTIPSIPFNFRPFTCFLCQNSEISALM